MNLFSCRYLKMYSYIPKPVGSSRRIRPRRRSGYDPSGSLIPAPIVQRGRRRSAPRTLIQRIFDLSQVPRNIIGMKAYGVALERENRQRFKVLHDQYQQLYNRVLNENVVEYYSIDDILIPHPLNVVYDYRVNYKDVNHILQEQERFPSQLQITRREFILNTIAYAYFWAHLRSLDEIIDDGNTTIEFTFNNPGEFGSQTTIGTGMASPWYFSMIPIVHIRDKPISGTRITLIFPVVVPPLQFVIPAPFQGTLRELVDLVVHNSIHQFHVNPAEEPDISLVIKRDRLNGGLEVELYMG